MDTRIREKKTITVLFTFALRP